MRGLGLGRTGGREEALEGGRAAILRGATTPCCDLLLVKHGVAGCIGKQKLGGGTDWVQGSVGAGEREGQALEEGRDRCASKEGEAHIGASSEARCPRLVPPPPPPPPPPPQQQLLLFLLQ